MDVLNLSLRNFCPVLLLTWTSFIDLMRMLFLECQEDEASLQGTLIFIYFSMSNHSIFDTQELPQDGELRFLPFLFARDHMR